MTKTVKYPTLEEFVAYIGENNLKITSPEQLYAGYSDGDWIDSRGNVIKNWKLKLRTLHSFRAENKKTKLWPINGKNCSTKDCNRPAVYKKTGTAYDTYCCSLHLPDKIKQEYY